MSKTLEQYLKENLDRNVIDHQIRASLDNKGRVQFYIHADGFDSDTLDFVIINNVLFSKYN